MVETKCYKVHSDFLGSKGLNVIVEKIIKIGEVVFDTDGNLVIWLNDDKDKKDLVKVLKSNGVIEYFCEPITYDSINKGDGYNFLSTWFVENYTSFQIREAEKQNQQQLRSMYNNIQRAQTELDKIKTGANETSMTKNNVEGGS